MKQGAHTIKVCGKFYYSRMYNFFTIKMI